MTIDLGIKISDLSGEACPQIPSSGSPLWHSPDTLVIKDIPILHTQNIGQSENTVEAFLATTLVSDQFQLRPPL